MNSSATNAELAPHRPAGIFPGLILAALIAAVAYLAAQFAASLMPDFGGSPVSPAFLAILLGLIVGNSVGVTERHRAGLSFALDALLKTGIALLGLRLSIAAVGQIGLTAIPVVVICITTALVVVAGLSRVVNMNARLGALIAVGTSICGCTAIMTVAPAIRARQSEICYAVSCVALFGTVGMLAYPFLANFLFGDRSIAAGMFLGTAIHDTAQVVGAGLIYQGYFSDAVAMEAATVTKLLRNLSMIVVIPVLSMLFARAEGGSGARLPISKVVPLFIVVFVGLSVVRTAGDAGLNSSSGLAFGLMSSAAWDAVIALGSQISSILLVLAMAAVGLSTSLQGLRKIGIAPLLIGFAAAALVGCVSIGLLSIR